MRFLDYLSWPTVLLMAVLLGLAPFTPEPHIWHKLKMLGQGTLTRPLDIFDLLLHGLPWLLLGAKAVREILKRQSGKDQS